MSRRQPRGDKVGDDPTEFVGRNKAGNVRPADDRYLTDEQIAKRDEYVEKVTGPNAQQLIAKREAQADADADAAAEAD